MNSKELFFKLHNLDLIDEKRYPHWWPKHGKFSVIIGVFLTQQSKWEKVERSLENLEKLDLLDLENLAKKEHWHIAQAIVPSGLYNQKAERIRLFCNNVLEEFSDLQNFKKQVSREWLLRQKGIGEESADSILNYFCLRPSMVVDSYTNRLLKEFDFTFESYGQIKEWLEEGIESNFDEISEKLGLDLIQTYMIFHGMIVEYCKNNSKRGGIDISLL
ncbi:MAG: 3-methyladenine DNA glycosylase [Campylobacterales bacterium]|nr:3-methyladenine DNA glycosylase [Campylobacterales bacterium]